MIFLTTNQSEIKKNWRGGGVEGGLELLNFFLQRIQISNTKYFFIGGGGGVEGRWGEGG